MNKEELIKNQFPNDEFLQSAVLRIVDKCTADLEEQLTQAKDIMKRFVDLSRSSRSILGDTWFDTLREAEDFLSEVQG